jgi:hypothetical protein
MIDPAEYDVFLCHTGADKVWVEHFGARLEAESIDAMRSGRKIRVFFDKWDIEGGENVLKKLGVALNKSKFVAVIMSPEFFESGWTEFEWTDVVARDPSGRLGHLIPVYLREASLDKTDRIGFPAPFKSLHRYDFRKPTAFEREFEKVLRKIRGESPARGMPLPSRYSMGVPTAPSAHGHEAWNPDRITDVLLGNLLEVRAFPVEIFNAETEARKPADVWKEVRDSPPFILRSGRLWTFADLTAPDERLRAVINEKSIQLERTASWLVESDKAIWLMDLLSNALATHLSKLAMKRDKKGRYFFRPERDASGHEGNRSWKNGSDRPRKVAAKKRMHGRTLFLGAPCCDNQVSQIRDKTVYLDRTNLRFHLEWRGPIGR